MRKTVWCVASDARLHWREWDGEVVLFHENSGNIHHLNLFAATAIRQLLEAPADSETLTERTASKLDLPVDDEARDGIEQLLTRLKTLGIARVAPS